MGVAMPMKVIPAFGNWDCYCNDEGSGLPITEYFESARAAGLGRGRQQEQQYTSFRKDQDYHHYTYCQQLPPYLRRYHYQYCNQKRMTVMVPNMDSHEDLWWEQRRQSEEEMLMASQQLQLRRSYTCRYEQQPAATAARKHAASMTGGTRTPSFAHAKVAIVRPAAGSRAPKAVDEDLYKIPPELLRLHQRATSRRRSFLRAWRCMGIHCAD